jgi:Zn-dependent protease
MAWLPNKNNSNGSGQGPDGNVYKLPPRPKRPQQEWPISPSFLGLVTAFLLVGGIMYMTPQLARGAVFPFVLAGWLITLCLHEFGHAWTADRFGDYTIREKGYLTLDPVKYADPIGSILFPVLILAFGGLGLPGGSVYVQKHLFKDKWQESACSAAGPAMNLLAMVVLAIILSVFAEPLKAAPILKSSLVMLAMLQASVIVFNLLPIPGFDGWGIIEPYLPYHMREWALRVGPIAALLVLMVLVFVPAASAPIWAGIRFLMDLFGLNIREAFAAFGMFQFWR